MASSHLCQKAALEQTTNTAADSELACMLCACLRGNSSPNHQVVVACYGPFKKGNQKIVDLQYVVKIKLQRALATRKKNNYKSR